MRASEAVVAPAPEHDEPCFECGEDPVGIHAELGYPACDEHLTVRIPDAEDEAYLRARAGGWAD